VSKAPPASVVLSTSLAMYDFPWTAAANDAVWGALSERLRAAGLPAPTTLTRDADLTCIWSSQYLVFGQTCGYPYITSLDRSVTLVATPIYDCPGCVGAAYRSFVIAGAADDRRELADFQGSRAAINGRDSNSGMNLFRVLIAPIASGKPFFREVIVSGSHAASLELVASGDAEIAAIDCVTFRLLQRGRPELTSKVRIVAESPSSPGLPFVIANSLARTYLQPLRAALAEVLADPALAPARRALGLVGAQVIDAAGYAAIAEFERSAIATGYPALA
jgi:ABC-type phosphate/phosphonate transport system substrate-binding protein